MGLFGKWFDRDAGDPLGRAESLLSKGEFDKALQAIRRAQKQGLNPEGVERIEQKIRQSRFEYYLEKARLLQQEGLIEEATDWVNLALEDEPDPNRREILEKLARTLEEQESREVAIPEIGVSAEEGQRGDEIDDETHFMVLIEMLDESRGEHYQSLGSRFQHAYVAMNTGRTQEAAETLDALLEGSPHESAFLFERARCALFSGEYERARDLLEKVWPALGDDPIDDNGILSVPALWAETCLLLEQPKSVLGRLSTGDARIAENPKLAMLWTQALTMDGQIEEAIQFLAPCVRKHPQQPLFAVMLAQLLEKNGEWAEAIEFLETLLAGSCNVNVCGPSPALLPSLRFLAGLRLRHQASLDRVSEILNLVAQILRGRLSSEDLLLLANYHQLAGDPEVAAEFKQKAEEIAQLEKARGSTESMDAPEAGEKAVL